MAVKGKDTTQRTGEQQSGSQLAQQRGGNEPQRGLSRRQTYSPNLWTGSPFSFMRRFSEEMDRLFEGFGFGRELSPSFGRLPSRLADVSGSLWSPQVEIFEREGKLMVRADLPGLTKDDVNVELTDDSIIIRGERQQENVQNEEGYYHSERSYGTFYRQIPLPDGVNADQAEASFRNGVLEITVPAPQRTEASKGRRLEIRGEGDEKSKSKAASR